jgi:hypothetical protein
MTIYGFFIRLKKIIFADRKINKYKTLNIKITYRVDGNKKAAKQRI